MCGRGVAFAVPAIGGWVTGRNQYGYIISSVGCVVGRLALDGVFRNKARYYFVLSLNKLAAAFSSPAGYKVWPNNVTVTKSSAYSL